MERAYTVKEIDDLREACENKWLWGHYDGCHKRGVPAGDPKNGIQMKWMPLSRSFKEDEKVRAVEDLVRTHMLAGHTAQDLYDSEQEGK